jgi:Protein of unknown function DUF262
MAMTDVSLRRPQAVALSIEDLVEKVRRGEIRLPGFQRPLKWKAEDVRLLFDSIYRGYPVGTLLFWRHDAPAARISFGPVAIDAPAASTAFWVIDGQQRLTSLTGVLLHPEEDVASRDDFTLLFDLENEQFVRPSSTRGAQPHWLPMNVVLDSERLLAWLDEYPGRATHPQHFRSAIRLGKIIREYQVPAYIVEADDEQVLRTIFDRLNTSGKRLTREEVFDALHGGQNGQQPSTLSALAEHLRELRFGRLSEKLLLKVIQAIRGMDVTKDFRRQITGAQLREALTQAERALRAVVIFLKRDASIPHVELLPYSFPVLPLARFFHLHSEPKPRSRELLARWFWRGVVTGEHRGERVPLIRKTLSTVNDDEEASVQRLLMLLEPPDPPPVREAAFDFGGKFNFRTAVSKIEANVLVSLKPRHLLTGEELDIEAVLEEHGKAAFVEILSVAKGSSSPINNRIVHPPLRDKKMRDVIVSAESRELWLESHGISARSLAALKAGNGGGFLVERWRWLRGLALAFVEGKARWDDSDRPSIDSLIVPDDEP